VDQDLHMLGRIVIDALDFNLSLFCGLDDGIDQAAGGLTIRKILDDQGFVIQLFYFGPNPERPTPHAIVIAAYFGQSSGGKIGL